MKNVSGLFFIMLIVAVLLVFLFSYQVRETQMALVMRFGEAKETLAGGYRVESGWHFKWPPPIERVYKFDSRSNLYESAMEETTTLGGDPIIVSCYMVWRVDDPLRFKVSVQNKKGAEDKLYSLLRNTQNSIIGQHSFSDFVNSDADKIHFEQIEEEMLAGLGAQAMKEYGIEIETVGIKRLNITEKVSQDVFERMKADRARITELTISQGEAEATKIEADSKSKRTELEAIAEAQAKAIRGKGDAEAAEYYKLLEKDVEFAMFLRDLEALKKILEEKTTIILGTETEPMKLLKGIERSN